MLRLAGFGGAAIAALALVGCTTGGTVPQPTPSTPSAVETSVTLYHCGVSAITYQGQKWEVAEPPFDETNKPGAWRGHGTLSEVSPTRLLYKDDSGTEVTFLPDAEVPPEECG